MALVLIFAVCFILTIVVECIRPGSMKGKGLIEEILTGPDKKQ